ncbi:MAG: hypothetical protein KGM43_14910 [Planctomycetota bacterium]|nr:hypothetical protein [Planctomycetota bacterium]
MTRLLLSLEHCLTLPGASEGPWAYLDPGAGSLVLQMLLAGFLSSLVFAKSILHTLKSWPTGLGAGSTSHSTATTIAPGRGECDG